MGREWKHPAEAVCAISLAGSHLSLDAASSSSISVKIKLNQDNFISILSDELSDEQYPPMTREA